MTDKIGGHALIRDLQSLIDFLDAHPELPLPNDFALNVYRLGGETLGRAKEIAKSLGTYDKEVDDTFFALIKNFGQVRLRFVFYRHNVCTKRVIGTKTETRLVPEADANMVERTVETEIVEWDCPSLLGETDEANAAPTMAAAEPPTLPPVDGDDIPF